LRVEAPAAAAYAIFSGPGGMLVVLGVLRIERG
jgi:hypothetical protein